MTGSSVASASTALTRSSRPAVSLRYSGSSSGPDTSSSAITGTPRRNTEPHQKCSSMTPPTIGPTAEPPMKAIIHTPIASDRCFGSVNRFPMRPNVDGMSVAPATPSSARAAIRASVVGAYAATTEAAPKAAAPISSSFLRPIRSPSVPIVTRNPAIMKP